jgi:hypothetical protein
MDYQVLDFAAARRALVQTALGANRRLGAAGVREFHFAALAAQDNVATAIDRATTAKYRALVHGTYRANRGTLFAAQLTTFDMPANTAKCDLIGGVMLVRHANGFRLAAAGHSERDKRYGR